MSKSDEDDIQKVFELLKAKMQMGFLPIKEQISSLFDGSNLNKNINERKNKNASFEDSILLKIIAYNGFNTKRSILFPRHISFGLWQFPSYINHSCLSNCHVEGIGDCLFIVSKQNIKADEEITVSYVPCEIEYTSRQNLLKLHGFECNCELCKYEKVKLEKSEIKRKFNEYLKILNKSFKNDDWFPFSKDPLEIPNFLDKNKKELSCYELGVGYYSYGSICRNHNLDLAIDCLEKGFRYNKGRNIIFEAETLFNLYLCYSKRNNQEKIKELSNEIKSLLIEFYFNDIDYVKGIMEEAGMKYY